MSAIHEPDLQLASVDEALAKGWTIPASWYADASVYALELERSSVAPGRSSGPSSSSRAPAITSSRRPATCRSS